MRPRTCTPRTPSQITKLTWWALSIRPGWFGFTASSPIPLPRTVRLDTITSGPSTELRQHFAGSPARIRGVERFEPVGTLVHETADPEVVAVEFRYEGSTQSRSFSLPCIFVVRVRVREIIESRDYSDHVAFAGAFGRLGGLAGALAAEAG